MKYIPIILLVLIIIIPAVTLLSLRKEIGLKQINEGKVIFFSGYDEFKFSFVSPKKNLDSVVLKLKNITIRSSVGRNSKPIYFKLLENKEVIREIQINGSNIIEDFDVRFTFPVIENSENKIFTVILNSPETKKNEELGINTDTLNNPVIITYHIPSSRLKLMSSVYENFATKILADKIFILIWLTSLSLLAYILLPHRSRKHS